MKLDEIKNKLPLIMRYQEPDKIKLSKEALLYDQLENTQKNSRALLEKLEKL